MAKNKIFIQDNSYTATIANGAIAAYSSRDGQETFNIDAEVTGIELDANFEKLSLAGNKNDYNIDFDASGYIAIKLISSGATVVTFPSLNNKLEISYTTQQIAETIEQTSATTLIRNGTTYSATTYTVTPSVTSVEEGNAVTFTVTPSSVSASSRTLNYQIKYVAVNSAIATDVNDFTKVTGSVTIAANATNTNFSVIPNNDGVKESFEGFQVELLDSNYVPVAISSSVVVSDTVSTGGMPFTLTTGINKFTGTSSDDSFDASLVSSSATLQSGDTLDGGDGIDTLSAALNAATYYTPTLTSVDIVKITDTAGATLSLAKSTGVTNLESVSSINAPTFLNIANTNVALKVSGQAVGASFGFTTAAVSGTADSATVTLDGMTAGTLTVDGIETLTLVSTGSPNAITVLTTSTASKIVVSGDTNLSTGTLGATVSVVDASVFGANLTTTMGAVTNATVKGGLGDDSITFTAVTGLASIFGGEGNDTIISTHNFVATDSIDGGNGTADVLSTNSAIAIALDTGTAPTTYTITNIEQLTIIDELSDGANALVVANIATGINTVNLKQASNAGGG